MKEIISLLLTIFILSAIAGMTVSADAIDHYLVGDADGEEGQRGGDGVRVRVHEPVCEDDDTAGDAGSDEAAAAAADGPAVVAGPGAVRSRACADYRRIQAEEEKGRELTEDAWKYP